MFNVFALASAGGGSNSGGIIGGGFDIGNLQLPGLVDFAEMFSSWLKALTGFWNALNTPLGDLFPSFGGFVDTGLPGIVSLLGLSDVTLLSMMLGGALGFYVVYQLVTWILNIIT